MSTITAPAPSNVVRCQQCEGPMLHVKLQPYACADCGAHLVNYPHKFGYHWEIRWGWLTEVETVDRDYPGEDDPIGWQWTFFFKGETAESEWVVLANGPDFASAQAIAEGYMNVYLRRIYSGQMWDHYFQGLKLTDWEEGEPDETCLWGDEFLDGRAYVWNPSMPEVN